MTPTAYGYAMPTQSDTDPRAAAEKLKQRVEDYYRYKFSNIRWGGVYIDANSSAQTPLLCRKAGGEMLKRAERCDHIFFSSLSIVFHTRKDLLHFLDYTRNGDLVLHFIEEHVEIGGRTAGEAVVGMLRALDRMADEPRRRAIRKTLNERRARGLPKNGQARLGFKLVGTGATQQLVPDEEEQAAMKRIFELHQMGMSIAEIRLSLRKDGIRFRRKRHGKWEEREWSESRIRRAYEAYLKLRQSEEDSAELTELASSH